MRRGHGARLGGSLLLLTGVGALQLGLPPLEARGLFLVQLVVEVVLVLAQQGGARSGCQLPL
ncbi:hypothetical protein [Streptomyces sp. NPDC004435]|uniref:hypothetical protein n=1 Tax=Streptomyces sp. NPDC004435 TaxID=3364701 RepID=UPI0036CC81C9